jgi:hypothetical protein
MPDTQKTTEPSFIESSN